MSPTDVLLPALGDVIDRILPDAAQRDAARLQLLALQGTPELQKLRASLAADAASAPDPWIARARPCFLYVMYVMILCALPMGVLAAFQPQTAAAVASGIDTYLAGIPSPLYTLFGTGYLGYTAARQWGKKQGTDR